MLNELSNVAALIDAEIDNDDFPSAVKPEYLRLAVKDYPCRGGKRLRPALLLWSCGLVDGEIDHAIPAAAAVEIYHNWTLVHDDIIDNDSVRRGMPTTHIQLADHAVKHFGADLAEAGKFGRDFAILAGDIQQGWAINMLLKSAERGVSAPVTLALCRRMQELVNRELISGEALDVEFPLRGWRNISSDEVMRMLYLKTGALLRFCAEAGAAIGTGTHDFSEPVLAALGEFAASAGIAFQLRDDWLGIFGDFNKFGKSIGADLAEAKPTILLLKTFELLGEADRKKLESLLGLPEYAAGQIETVRNLMRDSGAEKYVLDQSAELSAKGKSILLQFEDNRYRRLLLELNDYLVSRDK
ncbi:MAG: polyprenyl synthetase family protein [Victivallaceae bacterium]|jgi:geranylgeranyl diphosphate synthase type I